MKIRLGLALQAVLWTQFAFAGTVSVKAPCSDDANSYLHSCRDYLKAPTTGAVALVTGFVQKAADMAYQQHTDFDPTNKPTGKGAYLGQNLCNLVPGRFTPSPEIRKNHVSDADAAKFGETNSCGEPLGMEFKLNAGPLCVHMDPTFTINRDSTHGTLEQGYVSGAYIAALACYTEQVLDEVASNNLQVHQNGAAQAMAQDFQSNLSGANSIKDKLLAQVNINDIRNCGKTDFTSKDGSDVGPLRQSAQQLCAARAALEVEYVTVATMELFYRASQGYAQHVQDQQAMTDIMDKLTSQTDPSSVVKQCGDYCKSKIPHSCAPKDSDITQCAKDCYLGNVPASANIKGFPGALGDILQKLFPPKGAGSCAPISSREHSNDVARAGFLPLGFLFGSLKKKRRRSGRGRGRKAARLSAVLVSQLGVLLVAMYLGSGCGNDNKIKYAASCPETANPATPNVVPSPHPAGESCCPNNPSQATMDPAKCSTPNPGNGPLQGLTQTGGDAGSAASTALNNAQRLTGPQSDAVQPGEIPFAQTNAASDSGNLVSRSAPADKGDGQGQNGQNANRQIAGRTGGVGGGGSGNSGSNLNAKTDPALGGGGGGLDQALAMLGADAANSAYSNSGGGAGGALSGGGFAGKSAALSADGVENTSFGDSGAKQFDAMASGDPEDYFTRIGIGDSLFKQVERRYTQTAVKWASQQAAELAPKR